MSVLEPIEVACTVRLICKAAAARYSGPQHTRIRLSQRVPTHAFAYCWGRHEAMRSLSYQERKQLLCLTAASGSIANLQLLLPVVGCTLNSDVCRAAASAGRLATCQWLRQQGCLWGNMVMEAAGRSGSRALCDWLIAAGCPGGVQHALQGAASAGHVGLVDQLLASYGPPEEPAEVLVAAAGGCDLPTLRRLHAALLLGEEEQSELAEEHGYEVVTAAAGSATPDWREKLEWLKAQGCPHSACFAGASAGAARCPDALDRLTWLVGHGWQVHPGLLARQAAERGDVEALRFALEAQAGQAGPDAQVKVRRLGNSVIYDAARNGRLAVLQHLHALGCSGGRASSCAASRGHLHVVAWLLEALGAGAVLSEEVFKWAVRSSSLPLLMWLRERGCVCRDASVLDAALGAGCSEEVLEWLLAQSCTLQLDSRRWGAPAKRGDLATLAWLCRRGCPLPEDEKTFTEAVRGGFPLPALRWLAEAGCPVDWDGAPEEARELWPDPQAVAGLEELCGQHAGEP